MRTARTFHTFIALIVVWSVGASHMPRPWMQANSPLDRLTPSRRYVAPLAVTTWLPATCSAGAAPPVLSTMTEIEIGVVAVVAPELSTARALTVYMPAATLVQAKLYGAVVSEPITVEPFRKSTRTTLPSGSLAFAPKLIVAGALNTWPAVGLVRLIV